MATSIPLALSLALSHSPRSLAHAQLQQLVGYPGPNPKKPQCDKETRGKTFAFTKTVEDAQGKKTKLVAAIHNCKQPMMLISTASTLIPTHPRVKAWRKTLALTVQKEGVQLKPELLEQLRQTRSSDLRFGFRPILS